LHCRFIGADAQLVADLSKYLSHAGATVGAKVVRELQKSDISIWLILPDASEVDRQALRTLAAKSGSPTRFITFRFGGETESAIEGEPGMSVDLDALTRASLLRCVATAAGRLLPAALDTGASLARERAQPFASAGKRFERVLVAEDNETNREVIERQLKLLGLDAEMTVNGRQALERWRSGNFHLVLTDVRMPIMDGYALATAIRAEETGDRRTTIIALTANALAEEEGKCRAAGMDEYLVKPITSSRLKAVIESRLSSLERATGNEPTVIDLAASPVNLDVLKSLIGDDPTGIAAVLEKFRVNSAQLSSELERAIEADLSGAVVDIAHKLKSGAFSIGAARLGELCVDIEHAAAGAKQDQLEALLPRFRAQMRAVHAFIDSAMR
jgi:CheY-like chemotaxis protein